MPDASGASSASRPRESTISTLAEARSFQARSRSIVFPRISPFPLVFLDSRLSFSILFFNYNGVWVWVWVGVGGLNFVCVWVCTPHLFVLVYEHPLIS
jgi:hypothetical protein